MRLWLLPVLLVSVSSSVPCDLCRDLTALIQDMVTDSTLAISLLEDIIIEVCGRSMNKTVCAGAVREMGTIVVDSLANHYLSPDLVCYKAGMCDNPKFIPQNLTKWLESVVAGKPDLPFPEANNENVFHFAHISDLHIDLEYAVGSATSCNMPLCCRQDYPGTGSAGQWGDYNCDLPTWTLNAGLDALSQHPVDFILMTGDYTSHNIWSQSHDYQIAYITAATEMVRQFFNATEVPVYPTIGNHECFPVNVFNMGKEQWLTEYIAELWGGWMGPEAMASIAATGSYSVLHKNTNLRIISLNTNACNNQNWWLFENVTDPGDLLAWLQNELQKAEDNGELVYIMAHIAPGMSTCLDEWGYHYAGLMDRYQFIIRGQYFGHSHSDEFQISRGVFSGEPLSVQMISPSYTTYTDINPSFRVLQADEDTRLLLTYYQYRMNLVEANTAPDVTPQWKLAYEFLSEYNLPNASITSIDQWVNELEASESAMLLYLNNQQTGVLPAVTSCDEGCRKAQACQLRYGVNADVMLCQNSTYGLQDRVTRYLMGSWVTEE